MLLIFFVTNKKTFLNVIIEEEDARAVAPGANQILPAKIINRGIIAEVVCGMQQHTPHCRSSECRYTHREIERDEQREIGRLPHMLLTKYTYRQHKSARNTPPASCSTCITVYRGSLPQQPPPPYPILCSFLLLRRK